MSLPKFEFLRVKSLQEGLERLSQYKDEARVLAGGTDLLVSMKQRLIVSPVILSIQNLSELNFIDYQENSKLRIGALTPIHSIRVSKLINTRYPILAQAARQIGSIQLSHMGTLGGNLCLDTRCWYYNLPLFLRKARPFCLKMGGNICNIITKSKKCFAVYSGDLAPTLIALGADIKLLSTRGERIVPLHDFYTGDGKKPTIIESDEILAEVQVRFSSSNYGAYLKYRLRSGIDFPLASAAVVLEKENGIFSGAKIVLGAIDSRPIALEEIEKVFVGKKIDDDMVEIASQEAYRKARPVNNVASTPATRRNMVKILVNRAFENALKFSL